MENRGGKRTGAGRKKGSSTKIKYEHVADHFNNKQCKTPLEVMTIIMNECLVGKDYKLAIEAAKGAAPYVHVRKSEEAMVNKLEEQRLPPMMDYFADHEIIVQSIKPTPSDTHDH